MIEYSQVVPETAVWVAGSGSCLSRWSIRNTREVFDLKGLQVGDRMRVQRLALRDSILIYDNLHPMFFDRFAGDESKTSSELYKMVLKFGSLKGASNCREACWRYLYRREQLWGYVECENYDAKAQVWECRRRSSRFCTTGSSRSMQSEIGTDGVGFSEKGNGGWKVGWLK